MLSYCTEQDGFIWKSFVSFHVLSLEVSSEPRQKIRVQLCSRIQYRTSQIPKTPAEFQPQLTKESEAVAKNARNIYDCMLGLPWLVARVISCARKLN